MGGGPVNRYFIFTHDGNGWEYVIDRFELVNVMDVFTERSQCRVTLETLERTLRLHHEVICTCRLPKLCAVVNAGTEGHAREQLARWVP